MAVADTRLVIEERVIEVVEEVETSVVNLELSGEEADLLVDILSRIGGNPERTRRGIADRIHEALEDAGVTGAGRDDIDSNHRAIYFFDPATGKVV